MFGNGRRRAALERAYPGIQFRPHSHGLLARFARAPAECIHLETDHTWMAALAPDTAYLQGKAVAQREPARPEASLCRACLRQVLAPELQAHAGKVVAFEPSAESVTQYFYVAREHFADAYLQPEVAKALSDRLARLAGESCAQERCGKRAAWLWFSQREVASLDESALISAAPGEALCAAHGAARLLDCLRALELVNLEYVNAPYGEAGAYVWL